MSALAEALVAAQRRALSAMEKAFVHGTIDAESATAIMEGIGERDAVDQERLLFALGIIRTYGAAPPAEPTPNGEPRKPEPASDAQLAFIAKLVKEKKAQPPDTPLTKAEAHEIIDTLQAGTFDPSQWSVPFFCSGSDDDGPRVAA